MSHPGSSGWINFRCNYRITFRCNSTVTQTKPLGEVAGSYTYFADNDVLVAKITPCFENGKMGIARHLTNGIGFGSSEFVVLRSRGQILPEYLFYFLSRDEFRNSGRRVMSGAVGHKRIPKDYMEDLQVPLPPIQEQKKIVAILDEAFAGLARARENSEANLKNAHELFENYQNEVFSNRDKKWTQGTLDSVSTKMEYGTSTKSKPTGKVPVLRMGNIQDGEIDWANLVYTDDPAEIERYALKQGDVLFNRTNSEAHVGKTAIFNDLRSAIFAGYLVRVHRVEEQVDGEYLNFFLNSTRARNHGKSVMGKSVNQANISASKLKEYVIPLPKLSEQRTVAAKLGELKAARNRLATAYNAKRTDIDQLKQSLLQKAFAGELT